MPESWEPTWTILELGSKPKSGGQGLTFRVSRAEDRVVGILKKLKNNRSLSARARMHKEAANLQILNTVRSANVPQLLDHNTELHDKNFTQLFLVTEFVDGPTLQEFVKSAVLGLEDALSLIRYLLSTVRAAHAEDILHRDIKPANIILRGSLVTDPVIIDYGLSFNRDDTNANVSRPSETMRSDFLDLPEMSTPGGDRRDYRSDITALGAILYFALTGNRVGQLADEKNVAPHRRAGLAVRDALTDGPHLSRLEAFFDRCFQQAIEFRFQTIDEFEQRLNAITQDTQPGSSDLSAIARRALDRLRATDRETQLGEAVSAVNAPFSKAMAVREQLNREVAPLQLSQSTGGKPQQPVGLERMVGSMYTWPLSVSGRQLVSFHFMLGIRGSECVLLSQTTATDQQLESDSWSEIAWSAPTAPDLTEQLVASVRSVVTKELERIADEAAI